jgi:hypothetical protein
VDASPSGDADVNDDADLDTDGLDADPETDGLDADPETPIDLPSPSVEASMPFWAVLVPVELNDLPTRHFLVDTGSDGVLLAKNLASEIVDGHVGKILFAGRNYVDVPCKTHDLETASGLLGVEVSGILGYEPLKNGVLAIDYRHKILYHLDDWSDELFFGDDIDGHFTTHPLDLLPSKIIMASARFEDMDEEVNVIIDTGTSSAVISQSVVDALDIEGDGRTILRGSKSVSPIGEMDTPIIRLRSLSIEGSEAGKMWATIHPDSYFDLVERVLGVEVEGIVGGGFLREFLVAIDYSGPSLHLSPYTNLDHIEAEFQMVGVEVLGTDDSFRVYTVFEGSDAEAQGIAIGDQILEIDGTPTSTMSHAEVISTLRGEVGTSLLMRLEHEGSGYEVEVLREDLLPDLD